MNRKFLGIALLLIIIMIMTFSACSTPVELSVPQNITLEGNLLTWNSVENATNYIVSINNRDYTANENEFRIVVDVVGQYEVRVKAVGDTKNYTDSSFSDYITYIYTGSGGGNSGGDNQLPRLGTPTGVSITSGQLTWNLIGFAVGYRVEITAPNGVKSYINVNAPPFTVVGDIDGIYTLRVMARANTTTHRDSLYSANANYEIRDGSFAEVILRAPVQLSYSNGILSWSRVNNATGYVISIDDIDSYTLTGNSSNYYNLDFDTVRVRQVKVKALGDGALYADSNYSSIITFPLNINNPPSNISLKGGVLSWSDMPEASGYAIRINDQEIRDIEEREYSLEGLGDGFYSISIKAQGDYIYYKDSPYSREFSYQVEGGQPVKLQLPTPENVTIDFDVILWDEVLFAEEYLVSINSGGIETNIITDTPRLSLVGYPDGLYSVYVKAIGDAINYKDSYLSNEFIHIIGDYTGPIILNTPSSVELIGKSNNDGLLINWSSVNNAISYQLIVNDTEIITNETSYEIIEYGIYKIRIRAIGDNVSYTTSPFTKEYVFEMPTRLKAPENIHITGDTLSWTLSDFAVGYQIEIKSSEYHAYKTTINDYFVLDLEDDGTYYIRVRAIGDGNTFIDSLFSQEVVYVLADGGLGGIDNPYFIEDVEDLDLIRNNPSAYFRLVKDIDLAGIEFEPICDYNTPFSGHFEGNGFTVSNLSIVGDNTFAGFFGYINGGSIVNLRLENVNIQINNSIESVGGEQVIISSYAGALYGYGNNIYVDNVNIIDIAISVKSNNTYLGLLGGYSTGIIKNVKVDGSISSDADFNSYIGGVTGYMNGSFETVVVGDSNTLDIVIINSSNLYLGGLAGRILGSEIIDITIDVRIGVDNSISAIIGGLAGSIDNNKIEGIEIIANIESSSDENARIGGLAGLLYSALNDINIVGEINSYAGNNMFLGGLAGETNSTLSDFNISVEIISESMNAYVGGAIGRGVVSISNGEANSTLSITIDGIIYTGGLAGDLTGHVEDLVILCDTIISGNIANVYAGGVAGILKGNIINLEIDYSNVLVDKTSAVFIGGAVGRYSEGNIANMTVNNVIIELQSDYGDVYAGGAVGRFIQGSVNTVDIINASLIINATSLLAIGGLIGESLVDIDNVRVDFVIEASTTENNVFAGGIAGMSNGDITDGAAIGILRAMGAGVYAGGIAGLSSSLNRVEFSGKIDTEVVEYNGDTQSDPGLLPIELQDNFTDLYVGGIVGYISGNIDKAAVMLDSINSKSDFGAAFVGGIVGNYTNSGSVRELSVTGIGDNIIDVESSYDAYVGGISGKSSGIYQIYYDEEREQDIIPAFVSADILINIKADKNIYAGGFAGHMGSNASGIDVRAVVEALSYNGNTYVGSIVGYMASASLADVVALSDVISISNTSNAYVGGIVGYMYNSNIINSESRSNVVGEGETVFMGGIAGYQDGSISYSYSMDNQYSYNFLDNHTLYIGGISGYMEQGNILSSYSVYEICIDTSLNTAFIGGIAGYINSGNLANLYSVVDIILNQISSEDVIGGFVGYNNGNISNSFSTGVIVIGNFSSTEATVGDFAGINHRALNNVISDKLMRAVNRVVGNGVSSGISQEAMSINCTEDGYSGWSDEIWLFRDNYYPRLLGLDSQMDTVDISINQQSLSLSPESETLDLRDLIEFSYGQGSIFRNAYFMAEDNPYISLTEYGIVDLFYNTPQGESIVVEIIFEGYVIELSISIQIENVITISGQGTEADPYIIDSAELMRYLSFNTDSYFRLDDDIDMSGIVWIPAGTEEKPFSGDLDGNNKKIKNLNIKENYQVGGLFGYTNGAKIKDLILEDVDINNNLSTGNYVAGALIANAYNTLIENITLSGVMNVGSDNGGLIAGSLIGYADNVGISSIESFMEINAQLNANNNYIGGLVGQLMYNSGIQASLYKSDISIAINSGILYYGGLAGLSNSSNINTSYAAANTTVYGNILNVFYAGGLVGRADSGVILDAYSASHIIIDAISVTTINIGGFVGRNTAQISRCYTLTDISLSNVSEFIGFNNATISDSYFVNRASYTSAGVGNNNVSGLKAIDSTMLLSGEVLSNWSNWEFNSNNFPRLADLSYQYEVISVVIDEEIEIEEPAFMINLLNYVNYSIDSNAIFRGFKATSNDSSVLAILRGGFALVMGDGQVDVDFVFDGGVVKTVTIFISGSQETLFASGSGTEADPFIIVLPEQFNNISQFKGHYFKLGNSLDFTGISLSAIGTNAEPFTGYFDGNNYSLENLQGESIFGYLNGATIKNLTINNSTITVEDIYYAGIIAREMIASTLNNVHIDSNTTLNTTAQYMGSFAGRMQNNSSIIASSSAMSMGTNYTNNRYIGGLVGRASSSLIESSEYSGVNDFETISNNLYFGGFVALARDLTIKDSLLSIDISVTSIDNYLILGGLIAISEDSTINNGSFVVNITVSNDETNHAIILVGGLIAQSARDSIINGSYDITIGIQSTDTIDLGGLVAIGEATSIVSISVDIDIDASGNTIQAGGIVSRGNNTINGLQGSVKMVVEGKLTTDMLIGGVVADNSGSLSNVSNMQIDIAVKSNGENTIVGGIIANQSQNSLSNVVSTTISIQINAENNIIAGGVTGYTVYNNSISESHISTIINININNSSFAEQEKDVIIGGLAGQTGNALNVIDSTILTSINYIDVGRSNWIGGLAGQLNYLSVISSDFESNIVYNDDVNKFDSFNTYIGGLIAESTANSSIVIDSVIYTSYITAESDDDLVIGGVVANINSTLNINDVIATISIVVPRVQETLVGGIIPNGDVDINQSSLIVTLDIDSIESIKTGAIGNVITGIIDTIEIEIDVRLVTLDGALAGGLVADNYASITNVNITGVIYVKGLCGEMIVGGLVGKNNSLVRDITTDINLSVEIIVDELVVADDAKHNMHVAGLIAINNSNISNVSVSGLISMKYIVDGTVNLFDPIDAINLAIGGIVALNNNDINIAYSDANVEQDINIAGSINGSSFINSYIGGLLGYNTSTLFNAIVIGDVKATVDGANLYVGGVVGYNDSKEPVGIASVLSLSSVYISHNDIAGYEHSGGFVGYHNDAVFVIEGKEYVSLILASYYNTDTINDSLPALYWSPVSFSGNLIDTSDEFMECGGKTTIELQTAATYPQEVEITIIVDEIEQDVYFETWSEDIWNIDDNEYPQLDR